MEILFATDGLPPATAAGELLRRLADPESSERHDPVFGGRGGGGDRRLGRPGVGGRWGGHARRGDRHACAPDDRRCRREHREGDRRSGLRSRCPGCWEPSLARSARVRQRQHTDAARVSRARSPGPPDTGPRTRATPRARRRGRVTVGRERVAHAGQPSRSRTASTSRFGPSSIRPSWGSRRIRARTSPPSTSRNSSRPRRPPPRDIWARRSTEHV